MRASTMKAGNLMGIGKPEVFSFDDGLAEQQGPILTVARPIVAALMGLDPSPHPPFPLMAKGKGNQILRWSGRCWRMLWFCWAMPNSR